MKRHCTEEQTNVAGQRQIRIYPKKSHPWRRFPRRPYLGGEAGGVEKACAAGKCCFFRAWIRFGRYSGSTHQREPFPLAWWTEQRVSRCPTWRRAHGATLRDQRRVKNNKNRCVHRGRMHRSGSQVPINKQHFSIRSPQSSQAESSQSGLLILMARQKQVTFSPADADYSQAF